MPPFPAEPEIYIPKSIKKVSFSTIFAQVDFMLSDLILFVTKPHKLQ